MSCNDASRMFLKANLSVDKWEIIRESMKSMQVNLPCYKTISRNRDKVIPPVNQTGCEVKVNLSDMICNTTQRTLEFLNEENPNLLKSLKSNQLIIEAKCGADGCGNFNELQNKQTMDENVDSSSLYSCGFVLLSIKTNENEIIWQNQVPNSCDYVRNLSLSYKSETKKTIVDTYSDLVEETMNFYSLPITVGDMFFEILGSDSSTIHFTMYDVKSINAITSYMTASPNLSTQSCWVCSKSKSSFFDEDIASTNENIGRDKLKFGISPLHCQLRVMEWLFNIAIKAQFKQNVSLNSEEFKSKKAAAQAKFAEKLKLKMFVVRNGYGTTNTGRTARIFFANPCITAEILRVPQHLIADFSSLLNILNKTETTDALRHEFEQKANKVFDFLKNSKKFQRFGLSPTVHRVLTHGKAFLDFFDTTPIGATSEAAIESKHKVIKHIKANNAYQGDLQRNILDIMKRSLFKTDPFFVLK